MATIITAELEQHLRELPDWEIERATADAPMALRRKIACSWDDGLALVATVGAYAAARNHHPDLLLSYGSLVVRWSTHSAGGISELDVECAHATDESVRLLHE